MISETEPKTKKQEVMQAFYERKQENLKQLKLAEERARKRGLAEREARRKKTIDQLREKAVKKLKTI